MNFKERFYQNYTSTHVTHRKGEPTLAAFRRSFPSWEKQLGPLLPPARDARIIDGGCGVGGLVYWLQQRGYTRAEGIDVSAEQIAKARDLGISQVRRSDLAAALKTRQEPYDAIILRDVIEHFPREEIVATLDACRDALSPGGRLIIQVPNAESPFFGRIRYGDFTHETAFSLSSLNQLLNVIGFEEIQVYPTESAVTGLKSFLRYLLWNMVKAVYHTLVFAELGRGRRIFTQGLIAVGRVSSADKP